MKRIVTNGSLWMKGNFELSQKQLSHPWMNFATYDFIRSEPISSFVWSGARIDDWVFDNPQIKIYPTKVNDVLYIIEQDVQPQDSQLMMHNFLTRDIGGRYKTNSMCKVLNTTSGVIGYMMKVYLVAGLGWRKIL